MERWELGDAVEREIDGLWFPAVVSAIAPEGLKVHYPEGNNELVTDLNELRTPRTETTSSPEAAEGITTALHTEGDSTGRAQIPKTGDEFASQAQSGLAGLQTSLQQQMVVPAAGSIVPLVSAPRDMVVHYLIKLCALGPEHCVLDLGCGQGEVLIHTALESGASVRGIDIQPEYIDVARARSQQAGITHLSEFMIGDFKSLDVTTPFLQHATVIYLFLLPTALEILGPLIKDCIALKKSVVTFQYHLDKSLDIEVRKEDLMGMMRLY